MDMRYISLSDGTCMGDELIVFETNAPSEVLKELERVSCQIYKNGYNIMKMFLYGQMFSLKKGISLSLSIHINM